MIRKSHSSLAGVADLHFVEGILKTHETHPYRTMAEIGILSLGSGIVINVDDIIEHSHCRANGLFQELKIQCPVPDVKRQSDGSKIADSGLVRRCIEKDLRAEVGAMHYPGVILR